MCCQRFLSDFLQIKSSNRTNSNNENDLNCYLNKIHTKIDKRNFLLKKYLNKKQNFLKNKFNLLLQSLWSLL